MREQFITILSEVVEWLLLYFWSPIQYSPRCSRRSIRYNDFFAVCLLGSDELWVYDQIHPWILFESLLNSLMHDCYSLVFLLRNFGLVWPTRLIFCVMGKCVLWWVQSCGAQSQWQKETWHTCIIAIKNKKMESIPTWIDLVYIMLSFLLHYSVFPWT